jgi:hypothetical protein
MFNQTKSFIKVPPLPIKEARNSKLNKDLSCESQKHLFKGKIN